jgi:hypothetical protein
MVGADAEPQTPAAASERGPLLRRFDTDPREQLSFARVRTLSALLALAGATAMLFGKLPIPALLIALLALLISLVWLRQARRAAASARSGRAEALRVHQLGFALDEGERTHWVAWSNVESIAVDEDRLDIVVKCRDAARLRLEPRYPGVDIYELVRTLDDARLSAGTKGDGGGDGGGGSAAP